MDTTEPIIQSKPLEVGTDPQARYFGIAPRECLPLPSAHAQIAETRLQVWSKQPATAR